MFLRTYLVRREPARSANSLTPGPTFDVGDLTEVPMIAWSILQNHQSAKVIEVWRSTSLVARIEKGTWPNPVRPATT